MGVTHPSSSWENKAVGRATPPVSSQSQPGVELD
jgi:hypothetical protein